MKNIVTIALLAGLVAGCATSPTPSLYTVDMTPSDGAGSPVNITLERLRVAESLHNKRLLIKTSPTEIEYYATAQWAASLDEILQEKFAAEFGPLKPGRTTYAVSGTLQAFEQVDMPSGNEAHVKIHLEVRPDGESQYSEPLINNVYDVSRPLNGGGPGDLVETLSACVEDIARAIVADIAALQ